MKKILEVRNLTKIHGRGCPACIDNTGPEADTNICPQCGSVVAAHGVSFDLHAGEILYGNIGSENRLDFTVIGPTVNLTARISGMHTSVGRSIIVSEQVQKAAQPTSHDLVSLGRYMLRGVAKPVELFTIYEG